MVELGKIDKPEVEGFKGKKKVYLVPLIFCGKDAPQDYVTHFENYWNSILSHLQGLEQKIGRVSKIYHEFVSTSGGEALGEVEKMNQGSYKVVKAKCDQGAAIEATEDKNLVEEILDWQRCLMIGLASDKVRGTISESYLEASAKRYQEIAQRIEETLKEGETGLLLISESHQVQFPEDLEVFNVFPPELDLIHRFLRDWREAKEKEGKEEGGGKVRRAKEKEGKRRKRRKAKGKEEKE
jgi:hypothetical protein